MKEIDSTLVDKFSWPEGPWKTECDKRQWTTKAGLPALIVRNTRSGHLCGYVGVSKGHPWFERDYCRIDGNVHGGLTYSNHCGGNVCHDVDLGGDDHVWWLGFDCAHDGDLSFFSGRDGAERLRRIETYVKYRDVAYVTAQCESLARQAAEATNSGDQA